MRAPLLLALLAAACGDAATSARDADAADAESEHDADAPENDASGLDAAAQRDASAGSDTGSFLDQPTFDDAAPPDACNRVLNDAPPIETLYIAAPMPDAGGGVIADGVYERVAVRHYTGIGGDAGSADSGESAVLWLTQGEFHFSQNIGAGPDDHLSGTFAGQDARLVLKRSCPLPEQTSPFDLYEASEQGLVFYSSSLQRSITYRRR